MDNKLNQELLIKNSLEYYDEHQINVNKIIDKIVYLKWNGNTGNTTEETSFVNKISFYDKDKKLLLTSAYEFLGMYIPKNKILKWAWAVPSLTKNNTFISRKILSYAFDLDFNNDYLLRSELINSTIKIHNDIQLDIHIAIASYLSKIKFIYKYIAIPMENDDGYYKIDNKVKLNKNMYDKYMIMYLYIIDYK